MVHTLKVDKKASGKGERPALVQPDNIAGTVNSMVGVDERGVMAAACRVGPVDCYEEHVPALMGRTVAWAVDSTGPYNRVR